MGAEGVEPSYPKAAGFKPAVSTVPPRAPRPKSARNARHGRAGDATAVQPFRPAPAAAKTGRGGEIVSVIVDSERMGELAPYYDDMIRNR